MLYAAFQTAKMWAKISSAFVRSFLSPLTTFSLTKLKLLQIGLQVQN